MKPDAVNTAFVLNMLRKLHRWSTADADKVFADLFNIVCDRRTLAESWRRLSSNKGSRTPGTDGVTRKKVEERPGGVAQFLEDIRRELRDGTYRPEPVRQRLIPKPGKPGKVRPLGIPTLRDRPVQMALKLVLEPISRRTSIRPHTASDPVGAPMMPWRKSSGNCIPQPAAPLSTAL
ncbi:hypothetical protein [Mesorhizobium sp. 43Arga]